MESSSSRGGYLREWFNTWTAPETTSITRRSRDVVSVRITTFLAQGFDLRAKYYGDELSWDELSFARLTYGTGTTTRWVSPMPGWEYKYDVSKNLWLVVNDSGDTVESLKTYEISELGISSDILSSHNFFLFFSIGFQSNELFLEAWKLPRGYKLDPETGEIVPINPGVEDTLSTQRLPKASLVDPFVSDEICWFRRGFIAENISRPFDTFTNELEQHLLPPPEPMHILRPCGPVRVQLGDYSTFGITHNERGRSSTPTKKRDANAVEIAEILLSMVFATVAYRGKPVYEPWMLWEIWKWIGAGAGVLEKEGIFDIIPNWG